MTTLGEHLELELAHAGRAGAIERLSDRAQADTSPALAALRSPREARSTRELELEVLGDA